MPDETKNYNLKFTLDDSQFQGKAKGVALGITGINQALELLQKGYRTIASAADTAARAIERGADFADVEAGFNRLAGQAGTTGEKLRNDLSRAALDTVTNFNLMKKASEELRAGLKPDEIVEITKAAKQFADEDGKSFEERLDSIAQSVIRGDDRFLKNLGIIIDNQEAYAEFAKKIGVATESLNELGKAQALREAAVAALAKRNKELGQSAVDAGDKIKQIETAFRNTLDAQLKNIAASEQTNEALDKLAKLAPIAATALAEFGESILRTATKTFDFNKDLDRGFLVLSNYLDIVKGGANPFTAWNLAIESTRLQVLKLNSAQTESIMTTKGFGKDISDLSSWMDKQGTSADDLRKKYTGLAEALKGTTKATSESISQLEKLPEAIPEITSDANAEMMARLEADQKEAFQNSVDFFATIWGEVIETGAFDLERALKEVAASFAATLTASLLGVSVPGGGFSGIGAGLAQSLLGGGGGGGLGSLASLGGGLGLGSLLGGTSAGGFLAGMGGTIGPVASGAEYSGMLAAGAWNPYILAGGAALAIGSQTNWFGLGGGMSAAQRERAGIRDQIAQMAGGSSLSTQFGSSDIFGIDFKQFEDGLPILEEAKSAVEGLALALAGGTDQSDAFSKIFAQLVTGFEDGAAKATNQNDILFATQQIMKDLGLSSDDAKKRLLELFNSGEISAEQFSKGIESLNQVAQDNLVGSGSVNDAVKILVQSLENDPAAALQAFQYAFREAAEVAGDQLGTVENFFVQVFGQEAISVFDQLRAAGVKTWQDIANASVDQIALIFNALTSLGIQADQVMAGIASATVNPQGGAPNPSALAAASSARSASGASSGGSSRQSEAARKAQEERQRQRERRANMRNAQQLFNEIQGQITGVGGLDEALLSLLGGGNSFSLDQIAQVLNSADFLGLGSGAGQFAENLLSSLGSVTGTGLAPLSSEVSIESAIRALSRSTPLEREFGPAAELANRARTQLQGMAFRGQDRIRISDLQGMLGGDDLLSGFTSLFGSQAGGRAAENLNSFVGDVIGDLRREAGKDSVDIDSLKELMEEAGDITKESFIKPLQDAQGELEELFENKTKRGVKRFIEETNSAIKRLQDIRQELRTTSERADSLLGSLNQFGQRTSNRRTTNVNVLNAAV